MCQKRFHRRQQNILEKIHLGSLVDVHMLTIHTHMLTIMAFKNCYQTRISVQNVIVCMAHPRRVKMVQQQIQRELADMLLHDKVLQAAVLPEAALGADMYLSSMATISDVEISKDLQVAKVFISVYGDEREQDIALEGLKAKAKYVRMGLGKRMSLRMTPEVRFIKDESLERGSRVLELLDKVKKEREPSATSRKLVEEEDDISWDKDEFKDLKFGEDENIIFIK
ncbi:unnamed protein product [Sphagnum tenellum]